MMRKISSGLAFVATLGFVTTAMAADNNEKVKPAELTCKELIEWDFDLVPVVYWIDGYSSYAGDYQEMQRDWFAVPVEKIRESCEKNPEKRAAEVIQEQHLKHQGGS